MAAETIRDAVIRTRIEVVNDSPMKNVLRELRRHTAELKNSKTEIKRLESGIASTSRTEVRWLKQTNDAMALRIRRSRELRREIEQRVQALSKENAILRERPAVKGAGLRGLFTGAGGAAAGAALGGGGVRAAGGAALGSVVAQSKDRISGVLKGPVGRVGGAAAIGVSIIAFAPSAIKAFQKAQEGGIQGVIQALTKKLGIEDLGRQYAELFGSKPPKERKSVRELTVEAIAVETRRIALLREQAALLESIHGKERAAGKDRLKEIENEIKAKQTDRQSLKEEFGFAGQLMRETLVNIAEQIKTEGFGSLSKYQLEVFTKSFPEARKAAAESARKFVDLDPVTRAQFETFKGALGVGKKDSALNKEAREIKAAPLGPDRTFGQIDEDIKRKTKFTDELERRLNAVKFDLINREILNLRATQRNEKLRIFRDEPGKRDAPVEAKIDKGQRRVNEEQFKLNRDDIRKTDQSRQKRRLPDDPLRRGFNVGKPPGFEQLKPAAPVEAKIEFRELNVNIENLDEFADEMVRRINEQWIEKIQEILRVNQAKERNENLRRFHRQNR